MASIARRRNRDGSPSWDATVRVVGYPTACQSFPTKLEAGLWATRTEAAAKGRTLFLARKMTVGQMLDQVTPRLKKPVTAAFAYWRAAIGHLQVAKVSTTIIAAHRDALLGAQTFWGGGNGIVRRPGLKPCPPSRAILSASSHAATSRSA